MTNALSIEEAAISHMVGFAAIFDHGEPLQNYEFAPGKMDGSSSRVWEGVSAASSLRGNSL